MILTCPNCAARFRVDPAKLGPEGRRVRCSACGHRWSVRPEEPAAQPAASVLSAGGALAVAPPSLSAVASGRDGPAPEDAPPPLAGAPTLGQPPSGRGTAIAGWLVVVLILLGLAGLVVGRNEVASAFPAMVAAYERLGLPVSLRLGLELKNLASRRVQEQGLTLFIVEGEVHNLSNAERPVPAIRVALLDGERNELDHALFKAEAASLAPGAVTRFAARIVDPPLAAKSFRVSFAPGS